MEFIAVNSDLMAQHKMAFNLGTDETNKEYKNFPKPT
jgi:hypothetical protein